MWDPQKDPWDLEEEYSPDQNYFLNHIGFVKYLTNIYCVTTVPHNHYQFLGKNKIEMDIRMYSFYGSLDICVYSNKLYLFSL